MRDKYNDPNNFNIKTESTNHLASHANVLRGSSRVPTTRWGRKDCVTNPYGRLRGRLQTTVITVISFRQVPGYGIDSRFGIRGYVKREQRKMLFSF